MLSRFELKRFRGLLPTLALIFAMLVPVIYGFVYLAANWDPYGRVKDLPVAMVNEDTGASYDDQTIQAGHEIQEELVSQKTFQWHVTDAKDADDGLADGRYYLVMHIPADFSRDLVSPASESPERAQITLRRNDANGFVIGSVTGQSQSKVESAVDKAAVEAYFKAVFRNLAKIRDGMVTAHDGADRLNAGLKDAKSGSAQLVDATGQANTAVIKLSDGANELNAKAPELVSGASQLQDGLAQLGQGSATLSNGATQVAGGTQELYDTLAPGLDLIAQNQASTKANVNTLNSNVQTLNQAVNSQTGSISSRFTQLQSGLDQLASAIPQVSQNKGYQDARQRLIEAQQTQTAIATTSSTLAAQSQSVANQLNSVDLSQQAGQAKGKLQQLNDGAHQVAGGASELHSGILTAQDGSAQLTTGATAAAGGIKQLADGLGQLRDGSGKLNEGATKLDGGLGELSSGAQQLSDGLADGIQQMPAVTPDEANRSSMVLSQPVDVSMHVDNPANVYGRGLAPLFFSIGMWVFGISGFLVMRPISGRLLAGRLNPFRLTLSAWLPFGTIAIAGGTMMLAATWIFLGLNPVHEVATVALVVVVAAVFSVIAHTMRMALGLPGSALLLVWLIFQLSSTGGTYPPAVLPGFFRAINPFMPITYSIEAFRVAISGGLWSRYWLGMVVLLVIGISTFVIDCLVVRSRQRFRITDLHPPLEH